MYKRQRLFSPQAMPLFPLVLKAYRLMLALPYTPEYTSERSMICCLAASTIPGAVEELALMK